MFDDKEAGAEKRSNFDRQLGASIEAAASWLTERQKPEGYWVGRLESNACMEAQWILVFFLMRVV